MKDWYLKKSYFSKFKLAYLKKFNLKKFWQNIKINKIDNNLKKLVDYYIESESLKESSNYWNKLAIQNLEQINRLGIKKFHSSVALNYFTWIYYNDGFIRGLFNHFQKKFSKRIKISDLLKKQKNLSPTQSINHNFILLLIYDFLIEKKQFKKLKLLEKNNFFIKESPNINIDNLTITQDKLNSLIEFEKIEKISKKIKKINFLEIGAGSGRTTETILRLNKKVNKFIVADIPPAIYINFLRIKKTFKNKKVIICYKDNSLEELQKIIDKNDVIFILPHQLKYIKKKFFDVILAIDCLHEMKKETIKSYMNIFNNLGKNLYFKIWEETYVWGDFNNYLNAHNKEHYFINQKWKKIFKNRCICPNNYIEYGFKL